MLLGARGADHVGAAGLGDLDCEVADAAGGRMDEDPVALSHLGGIDQRLPGGEAGEREAARLLVGEGIGCAGELARGAVTYSA